MFTKNFVNQILWMVVFLVVLSKPEFAATPGTIKGKLIDGETKLPLLGANVLIFNSDLGTATNADGNFEINNIDAGAYSLKFSYIGYESKIITDVIVRPGKITFVDEELISAEFKIDSVVITSGYFNDRNIHPESVTNFSYEEIRRAPGAAGDVSRILMSLPGAAKVNDQSNSLIIRGGSPSENAFFIGNIEVPNINHFPMQGSTGGAIGMVNVDLIKDLNFFAGGFSSLYGDKLSSVMEINFREGNKDEFEGKANLDFAGFGGTAEGPIFNKGSYIFSIRRSYLDLLIKAIDIGTSIAPRYSDYQWNIVYNFNPNHKLSFIGLIGDDISESNENTAEENKMEAFGKQTTKESTLGFNLQSIWGTSGYSNTSLSYTGDEFKENYFEAGIGTLLLDNNSSERMIKLRNINHFNLEKAGSVEFGTDVKYLFNNYKDFYGASADNAGTLIPSFIMNKKIEAYKAGLFLNFSMNPFERITTTFGIRSDYFAYNDKVVVDPRFSFSYRPAELTTLYGAAGIFHQTLPPILLAQNDENKNLKDTYALHFVLGADHLLTESTKLTFEIYDKEYFNFPVDPAQPSFFIIDEDIYGNSFYSYHQKLIGSGKAYSRGIELMVQKKLAKDFYGLAGASYSSFRYKALDGVWRDRVFDNKFTFSFEGGYKPNNEWEFSARWIYAGGVPYTPFNQAASASANSGIIDVNKVNEERYPPYHSLNVRVDKRFNFNKSNIVFYISIWNAYSRNNVARYYWNSFKNEQDTIYQWTLLPIFGVKYEF